jgi:hypothetical protein
MGNQNMSDDFESYKALYECFDHFSEFFYDFEVLVREGYIKVTDLWTCKWLKSKTSLAEYFKWACGHVEGVPGGFWAPVENAFGIKRHSLRRLAGQNGNEFKRSESRDFRRIKAILEPIKRRELEIRKEVAAYSAIKYLINVEAKDEKLETIHKILIKISEILINFVDKNRQNLE